MERDDILWKQYELNVALYKFHLELAVKVMTVYYAITGALLAYHFQNKADVVTRYGLYLPIALSLVLSILFFYGATRVKVVREEVHLISAQLKLHTAPALEILTIFLWSSGGVMLLTGVCLLAVVVGRFDARVVPPRFPYYPS